MSTRTLKDHLSEEYLHRAEAGERVVVLSNGRPIAALVALDELPPRGEGDVLTELGRAGRVRLPAVEGASRLAGPVVDSRGTSAGEMVLQDRR